MSSSCSLGDESCSSSTSETNSLLLALATEKRNDPTTQRRVRAATAGASRRKQPKQRIQRVFQEIYKLQMSTGFLIPRLPFARVVREIMMDLHSFNVTRITKTALEALQEASEIYLTQQFEDSYLLTLHRGRITLSVKDMETLRFLHLRNFGNVL